MITFVTGNKNKLAEVQALLGADLVSQDVDLVEVQGTYQEIIEHKAKSAADIIGGPVMVEDTALEFVAYGKELPGPYIKWFLKSLGPESLPAMLAGFDDKSAYAVCTVGYCEGPGQPVKMFQGKTAGSIVDSRGPTVFGWDSNFQPDGYDQTYAELDKSVKNSISHRGKAMAQFRQFLESK